MFKHPGIVSELPGGSGACRGSGSIPDPYLPLPGPFFQVVRACRDTAAPGSTVP